MRFKHRMWLLPVTMAVIVFAGIAINSRITARAASALERVQHVQYPAVEALRALNTEFSRVQDTLQQAVTEGDENGVEASAGHAAAARAAIAQLEALEGRDGALANRLGKQFDAYYTAASRATNILLGTADGDPSRAVASMQSTLQALGTSLEESNATAVAEFQGLLNGSVDDVYQTLTVSMITALIMLAAMGLGSWILINKVFTSLGGEPELAADVVRRIADGDFTTDVSLRPGDSGSLLYSIAVLKAQLGTLISDIRGASQAVDSAATEMHGSMGQLSQRTAGQAASLEETATSMEEMTATVRQSADNSRHATDLANAARKQAQNGGDVVGRAVEAMSQINGSSEKIADIIGVIDEIAFQTNLLALNAAVEAARAGDQGRGFAVVASEVRNLAQRSSSAAREIKELIEDSVAKVQDGQNLVNESGEHLTGIVSAVREVAEIIGEISAASQEQSAGLDQVNRAVMHMDEVTQQNAAMVDQVTGVAQLMASQARELTATVGRFRIDENGAHHATVAHLDSARPASRNRQDQWQHVA